MNITITETTEVIAGYVSNNLQTVTTAAGDFAVEQRNVGFADNDGQWIVSLYPDLYWGTCGVLRERRPGRFLGVFADTAAVVAAIEAAEPTPEHTPFHKSLN